MGFQLSDDVDQNKVFLVKRGELKGRLDTVFYHPKYENNEEAIKKSKWGFQKIGNIVKRIVEKLGGQVGVESASDQGSVFSFTLPISD